MTCRRTVSGLLVMLLLEGACGRESDRGRASEANASLVPVARVERDGAGKLVRVEYWAGGGERDGVILEFWPSGQIKELQPRLDLDINGIVVSWNPGGTPAGVAFWADSMIAGPHVGFDENGALQATGSMFDFDGHFGSDGPLRHFWPNGTMMSEVWFVRGYEHGERREWFETGALRQQGQYVKGEAVGEWVEYFRSGEVRQLSEFIPRSSIVDPMFRPKYRRRRCAPGQPLVEEVRDGEFVPGVTPCRR